MNGLRESVVQFAGEVHDVSARDVIEVPPPFIFHSPSLPAMMPPGLDAVVCIFMRDEGRSEAGS